MVISGSLLCCIAEGRLFPDFRLIHSTDLCLLQTTLLSRDFRPAENKAASQLKEYVFCQSNMSIIVRGCKLPGVREDQDVLRGETREVPEYPEVLGPSSQVGKYLSNTKEIFLSHKAQI